MPKKSIKGFGYYLLYGKGTPIKVTLIIGFFAPILFFIPFFFAVINKNLFWSIIFGIFLALSVRRTIKVYRAYKMGVFDKSSINDFVYNGRY